jgi:hypothetical protein
MKSAYQKVKADLVAKSFHSFSGSAGCVNSSRSSSRGYLVTRKSWSGHHQSPTQCKSLSRGIPNIKPNSQTPTYSLARSCPYDRPSWGVANQAKSLKRLSQCSVSAQVVVDLLGVSQAKWNPERLASPFPMLSSLFTFWVIV